MSGAKRIVILGGGFGGIRTALALAKRRLPGVQITLVTEKPHFEYCPALYRIVIGRSARQVCVPLVEIFAGTNVEIVQDFITAVNLKEKRLTGGTDSYEFDYLILALGSESSYFNIPGIAERSRGFKTIHAALDLKRHIHAILTTSPEATPEQKTVASRLLVVGGGPTGIEIAAELVDYVREVATKHGVDPSFIAVDLIEAAPRLLPAMPADFSEEVREQLYRRGVNVYLNRSVMQQDEEELILKDMRIRSQTVIWTAGVRPNRLYAEIEGLTLDKRGKVVVTDHLQAKGFTNVFAIGDGASTQYSGMAQTADYDGAFIARALASKLQGGKLPVYRAKRPVYAIPAGPNWAAVLWGPIRIYGVLGNWLRHAADLRYFLHILPLGKAFQAVSGSEVLAESCPVCLNDEAELVQA